MSEINSLQNTNYLILGKNFFTQISNLCKTSYHRHEFVEFVYVVSGNCMHLYNGEKEKVKIGDAYLFRPKKDVHGFISESSDPITHRDLIFGVDFFQKLCSALSPNLYQDFLDGEYALKMTLSNEHIFQLENLAELRLKTENSDMYERALGFYVINLMISNKSHNAENAADQNRAETRITVRSGCGTEIEFNVSDSRVHRIIRQSAVRFYIDLFVQSYRSVIEHRICTET